MSFGTVFLWYHSRQFREPCPKQFVWSGSFNNPAQPKTVPFGWGDVEHGQMGTPVTPSCPVVPFFIFLFFLGEGFPFKVHQAKQAWPLCIWEHVENAQPSIWGLLPRAGSQHNTLFPTPERSSPAELNAIQFCGGSCAMICFVRVGSK